MRRKDRRVFSDPEVLELFQEEPELLAIVDAIAATQPRPQQGGRRAARALLAATIVASVVLVAIFAPWPRGGGGVEERALAAVGTGEVVHAVLRTQAPGDVLVVELTTSNRLRSTVELESWFDRRRALVRTVTRRNGVVIADSVAQAASSDDASANPPAHGGSAEIVASTFVAGYVAALEVDRTRVVGRGAIDGRKVAWLEFTVGSEPAEVAVDERTGRPVRVRSVASGAGPAKHEWNVAEMETLAAGEAAFIRPAPLPAGPSAGTIEESREASLNEATAWLGAPLVSPGEDIDGLRLASVRVQVLSRRFPDGAVKLGRGVELIYRATQGRNEQNRQLRLRQAPEPEPAYGFVEGRLTFNLNPIPRAGVIDLAFDERAWLGQLRVGGLHVTLHSPDRRILLSAARRLAALSPDRR